MQTADHRELHGKKGWIWGQGDDDIMNQRAPTDEDGPCIEVLSGPLPTQSDYAWVHPSQEVFWREQWTPVFGLGEGFEYATPELVVERVNGGERDAFPVPRRESAAGGDCAAERRRSGTLRDAGPDPGNRRGRRMVRRARGVDRSGGDRWREAGSRLCVTARDSS